MKVSANKDVIWLQFKKFRWFLKNAMSLCSIYKKLFSCSCTSLWNCFSISLCCVWLLTEPCNSLWHHVFMTAPWICPVLFYLIERWVIYSLWVICGLQFCFTEPVADVHFILDNTKMHINGMPTKDIREVPLDDEKCPHLNPI